MMVIGMQIRDYIISRGKIIQENLKKVRRNARKRRRGGRGGGGCLLLSLFYDKMSDDELAISN